MEIQRQQTSLCGVGRWVSLPGLVLSHTIGNPTQATKVQQSCNQPH